MTVDPAISRNTITLVRASKADVLADIGREIERLERRDEELDRMRKDVENKGDNYLEEERNNISDRLHAMRHSLSTIEASTLEGAILQLAEAFRIAEERFDMEEGDPEWQRKSCQLRFRRLMFSILRFLRDDPKFDLPSLGVYLLMGEHLDPWTSWERHWIVVEDEPRTSWPALTGASRRSRVTELLLLPP